MADDVYTNNLLEECGVLMSPHFPGVVRPGLWSWVLQAPQDTHFILYVYYVIGPAIVSEHILCDQYFAGWFSRFPFPIGSVVYYTTGSYLKAMMWYHVTLFETGHAENPVLSSINRFLIHTCSAFSHWDLPWRPYVEPIRQLAEGLWGYSRICVTKTIQGELLKFELQNCLNTTDLTAWQLTCMWH